MSLTIGQLAKQVGVRIDTVRYYERRGLLPDPPRRPSGYRDYPADTVHVIRFIKEAQHLGFTLDEIAELLTLREAENGSCGDVRQLAERKQADIEAKLKGLRRMRKALSTLVRACNEDGKPTYCPILESLAEGKRR